MQHLNKSNFYPHQREADLAITREFDSWEEDEEDEYYSENEEYESDDENSSTIQTKRRKCLVRMFCGTGKSLLMRFATVNESASLIAFVMPSLALISQFAKEYLGKGKQVLIICSDEEGTTNISKLREFLQQKKKPLYLCVTYASLPTLIDALHQEQKKIDVCHFDEAHRAVGTACQSVVFGNDHIIDKHIFYTATPINRNGIVMQSGDDYTYDCMEEDGTDCEKEDMDMYRASDCGRTVYTYSYLQAEADQRLNPFHVHIDLYLKEGVQSIYESIARAVFETGNTRVLTFHSSVSLK